MLNPGNAVTHCLPPEESPFTLLCCQLAHPFLRGLQLMDIEMETELT